MLFWVCETYFLLLFDRIPCRLCIFCSCTSRDLSLTFCSRSIIASKNGMYFCISANFLSYSSILFDVYRSPVPGEKNLYAYKYFSTITSYIIRFFSTFIHLLVQMKLIYALQKSILHSLTYYNLSLNIAYYMPSLNIQSISLFILPYSQIIEIYSVCDHLCLYIIIAY